MRSLLILAILAAALQAAEPATENDFDPKRPLRAGITGSQPIITTVKTGEEVMIYFALVNEGAAAVEPGIEASSLTINGKELKEWPFIVAGGPRDERWKKLPAGDSLQFSYELGEHFRRPGTYKVQWSGALFRPTQMTLRVLPKIDQ